MIFFFLIQLFLLLEYWVFKLLDFLTLLELLYLILIYISPHQLTKGSLHFQNVLNLIHYIFHIKFGLCENETRISQVLLGSLTRFHKAPFFWDCFSSAQLLWIFFWLFSLWFFLIFFQLQILFKNIPNHRRQLLSLNHSIFNEKPIHLVVVNRVTDKSNQFFFI